jgi:hypothetical protein
LPGFWPAQAAPVGFFRFVEWPGLNRDWPAALWLFIPVGASQTGPSDRNIEIKSIYRSSFAGFGSQEGVISSSIATYAHSREIFIPLWAIQILAATPIAFVCIRAVTSRHRQKVLHCRHCNYDLRASTDRCPECGHPIPAAAAKPQAANNTTPTATPPADSST